MKSLGVRDLAKLAKVSLGTVDRALNERSGIKEETRARILAIAREHGYMPNLTARALSFARSTIRVGLCIPREIHYFYDHLRDGVTDEAQRYTHVGLEVIYRPVRKLNSPATRAVNFLFEGGIDALILTPGSSQEMISLIRKAERERNVRVVCVATDDSPTCRSTAISADPDISGALAAELMAKVVSPRSEVAIITGMLSTEEHRKKVEGFRRIFPMDSRGGTILQVIEGHEEESEVYRKTMRLLREHPNLSGIYVSTVNCIPVCRAVEALKISGKIKIIATDLFADMEPYFANGTLCASVYQNPYLQGQIAMRMILDHFLHGKLFPNAHYVNPVVALRSNLSLFREMHKINPAQNGRSPALTYNED
jgi:LacI family transcriptional regulator